MFVTLSAFASAQQETIVLVHGAFQNAHFAWKNLSPDLKKRGLLVPVLEAYAPLDVPLYVAYMERKLVPATIRAVVDHLQGAFGCANGSTAPANDEFPMRQGGARV